MTDLETSFTEHCLTGLDAFISLAEFIGQNRYEFDLVAGHMIAGDTAVPLSLVGTWAKPPQESWLWAWANPGFADFSEGTLDAANQLRAFGKKNAINDLTNDTAHAENDTIGFKAAAIAVGLTGADGAIQYQHDNGSVFFTFPSLPSGTSNLASRHIRVITQGLQNYDVHHQTAITSYLTQKGYTLQTQPDGLLQVVKDNDTFSISFDELGRMTNLDGSLKDASETPAPKPKSFFSRLFKG